MELEHLQDLGIALGLGLLVGLEREWSDQKVAGIRTFSFITLFGALCGIVAQATGALWIVPTGLIAVAAMFMMGNRINLAAGRVDPGLTTEVAGLVMFLAGAAVVLVSTVVAVVTGGVTAVLLHWKGPLHRLAGQMSEADLRAVVRLALIGMVILPVLPDETYGPYNVLNPRAIWLMVVLIVGISLAAYVAQRMLGARTGTLLAGLLGGLISSTATTVSFARRSTSGATEGGVAAIVIVIASAVVFGRVLIEIAVVAPTLLRDVGPPLGAMLLLLGSMGALSAFALRHSPKKKSVKAPPAELKAAIAFGLLYAAVLFAVAAVREHFGDTALYVVATLSGLTDMDAITLSSAQLMKSGALDVSTGWRLILVGSMANLVFKLGVVALLGTRQLVRRVAISFGVSLIGGVAILLAWPG